MFIEFIFKLFVFSLFPSQAPKMKKRKPQAWLNSLFIYTALKINSHNISRNLLKTILIIKLQ